MTTLDERLRSGAANVRRQSATADIPSFDYNGQSVDTRMMPHRRVGLVLAGAVIIGVGGIALFGNETPDQITGTDVNTAGTTAPVVRTELTAPVTTVLPTTTVDTVLAPPWTVVESLPEATHYRSFVDVSVGGAPVGLSAPPTGFAPAFASGPDQGSSGGSGSLALVEVDEAGLATGNSILVGVSGIPPYQPNIWDEGGSPDGELITLGEVTGRWRMWAGTDEPDFFSAPIDEQHRVTVSGTLPRGQIEDFIATISFGDDVTSPSFDTLPGYVLVDTGEGITNGEYSWTVNYSTADQTSQFLVTTVYRPSEPLIGLMLSRDSEQLTVRGLPAIAAFGGSMYQMSPLPDGSPAIGSLFIDVRPDLRVEISNLIGGPDDLDANLPNLDLLALAADLVAFTPSGWDEIVAIADAREAAVPTYEVPSCSAPTHEVTWDAGEAPVYSEPSLSLQSVEAGWPIEVTITAAEGFRLDNFTLRLTNPGAEVELAHIDTVLDTETVSVTWDGIVSGTWDDEPVPPFRLPGNFGLGFEAAVIDLTGKCGPQTVTGHVVDVHVVP